MKSGKPKKRNSAYDSVPQERTVIEVSAYITVQHHPDMEDDLLLEHARIAAKEGDADVYEDPRIVDSSR